MSVLPDNTSTKIQNFSLVEKKNVKKILFLTKICRFSIQFTAFCRISCKNVLIKI